MKFSFGPLFTALLLSLAVSSGAAGAELIDRIVVVVNDDLILESEVALEMAAYMEADPRAVPQGEGREQALAELRGIVVEGLIGRQLSDQAVARLGIVVEESEVDGQLAETARMNNMTVDQLVQELARQGIPVAEFRNDMRDQIKQYRLFQAEIGTKIDIGEELLRQRYNERYANVAQDPEYHLRMIALVIPPGATAAERAEAMAKAEGLREEIKAGRPFEEVAIEHSEDAGSAAKGGEFGKVRPRALIPEFREAVEELPLNDVSEIVVQNDRLFMFQVYRITNAAVKSYDEMVDILFEELYREEEERQIELWIEREKARAHIEYLH